MKINICALIFNRLYDRIKKMGKGFFVMIYTVTKIEGEYASLTDEKNGEELFIALALLPINIDIGVRLLYENMEFSVVS